MKYYSSLHDVIAKHQKFSMKRLGAISISHLKKEISYYGGNEIMNQVYSNLFKTAQLENNYNSQNTKAMES